MYALVSPLLHCNHVYIGNRLEPVTYVSHSKILHLAFSFFYDLLFSHLVLKFADTSIQIYCGSVLPVQDAEAPGQSRRQWERHQNCDIQHGAY